MSVAGLIDAMRSSYSPAVRLVWQCLENHANGARFWSMTDQAIARELNLSVDTVSQGIAVLEADGIIKCDRRKRRPSIFRMQRTYPERCPRPRYEPEVARRIVPELSPEIPGLMPELSPEIPETRNPPVKNPPEKEGESAHANPPQPILQNGEGQTEARPPERPPVDADLPPPEKGLGNGSVDVRRGDTRPPRSGPLPDDWTPSAEDLAFARSRGLDPEETTLAFGAYYRGEGKCRTNWSEVFRSWCIREGKFYPPRAPRNRAEREAAAFQHIKTRVTNLAARGITRLPTLADLGTAL
jgi:hypothetical protein